jgi:hypothetical protein
MTVKKQPLSTRALIDQLAEGDPEETLSLGELLDRFSERAFGLFLFLAMLPSFIPLPTGAGAISGVLSALIGLQFLLRLEHPWLPGFLARRRIHRHTLINFRNRMGRWLDRLGKLTRPRNQAIIEHPVAHAFTGLQLVLLGVLLSLPLPLTNYLFGFILLCYAFALIERDGRLMLLAWTLGLGEILVFAGFSGQLAAWGAELLL